MLALANSNSLFCQPYGANRLHKAIDCHVFRTFSEKESISEEILIYLHLARMFCDPLLQSNHTNLLRVMQGSWLF
jgi:hypothetical protein